MGTGPFISQVQKPRLTIFAFAVAALIVFFGFSLRHPTFVLDGRHGSESREYPFVSGNQTSEADQDDEEASITNSSAPSSSIYNLHVYPPPPPPDEDEHLAVCMLVKEVVPELREFFTHHYYHHGIRRFYLYDDGSNPPLAESLGDYNVPESVLTFTYVDPSSVSPGDERLNLQEFTMERCVKEHGSKHHWMALLDPDEFIEMRHAAYPILIDWLKSHEENDELGGLAVSWLPHNSAGRTSMPEGGFRENFNECVLSGGETFWLITHNKLFVRTNFTLKMGGPHYATFEEENVKLYDEHMSHDFTVAREPPTHEFWALHHYGTGSREYFERKGQKGRTQGPGQWPVDERYWARYHEGVETYECNELVGYVP